VGKCEHVKGPRNVTRALLVKFEAANAYLKSIHALAIVAQLLVAVLDLVECVNLIFETDRKSGELSVERDKICGFDRANHELESLTEI
jgi:hypothetical protein